jgi:geranylgeranyl diphosphate synthase type II
MVHQADLGGQYRASAAGSGALADYLEDCRALVLDEIKGLVPKHSLYGSSLYELILDYPLRGAKALRPALCIAACRALGGTLEGVLKSAATLELYHNAFLIHDDIEDGSEKRRDRATLHRLHGTPIAINVGDAMLALAMEPLLDNTELLGLGKSLRILRIVTRMARESAEGQAVELSWVRDNHFQLRDQDYLRMVHKKTTFYTFIAPLQVGAVVAGADPALLSRIGRFATLLGLAFQIQDDVLNLDGDEAAYGKELFGDLWEGKHTLILMHALRAAAPAERAEAMAILWRARPQSVGLGEPLADALRPFRARREISDDAWAVVERGAHRRGLKTEQDIATLLALIRRHGSIEYARKTALERARRARRLLGQLVDRPSVHLRFLQEVTDFVITRDR